MPFPVFVCCLLLADCRPQHAPHAPPDTTAEFREPAAAPGRQTTFADPALPGAEPGLDGWLLQGQAASSGPPAPSPYPVVQGGPARPGATAGTGRGAQLRRPMTSRSLPTAEGFLWNAGFEYR